jgi:hypothetical protein
MKVVVFSFLRKGGFVKSMIFDVFLDMEFQLKINILLKNK